MPSHKHDYEELWYWYLTGQHKSGFSAMYERQIKLIRSYARLFPGQPRCVECDRPLFGWGSRLSRSRASSFSPRLCNDCEAAMRQEEAGAEVELSLLFADVRGSTRLAENSSIADYKQRIQRFYQAASAVLIEHNALVNRLVGDQVIGLFVPRFAGDEHAKVAVAAARDLLRATGHANPAGPWIPVGIGIHTGPVYVGAVGSKAGVNEIAVLGSAANLAARLSSAAAQGEIYVSEAAAAMAGLAEGEQRQLELKGISQPVGVRVVRLI